MIAYDKPLGSPINILLVEDNPAHAQLFMRTFENHHVENKVYHISNGEAALDFLFHRGSYTDLKKSPRPQLVLLDLRLMRLDGFEVLQEIRSVSEFKNLPVAIITSSEAEKDIAKAREYKVIKYLVKPVTFEKFSQLLEDLGFYWVPTS